MPAWLTFPTGRTLAVSSHNIERRKRNFLQQTIPAFGYDAIGPLKQYLRGSSFSVPFCFLVLSSLSNKDRRKAKLSFLTSPPPYHAQTTCASPQKQHGGTSLTAMWTFPIPRLHVLLQTCCGKKRASGRHPEHCPFCYRWIETQRDRFLQLCAHKYVLGGASLYLHASCTWAEGGRDAR